MLAGIKVKLGLGAPPPPPTLPMQLVASATAALEEGTPTLTWRQRGIGFGVCMGVGVLLSFVSLFMLWSFQLTSFAVLYSFGSILSLLSTAFLMGPCKQLRSMTQSGRWIASLVYVGAIAATLGVAFGMSGAAAVILVLVLLVVQFTAMIWYCLTYIPGGNAFLGRMVGLK